jgi:chromate reductase, NAD(P)H dehydrogenase (quinone)
MRVLGISGSLRRDSHNTRLLRLAGRLLPPGTEFEVYEDLKAIPPYDADDDVEPLPTAVADLKAAIEGADAVLVASPEYNGSMTGVLKNALDWVSRPVSESVLRNKPVAVIGASTGMFGAVWAQAEARKVLSTIGARVVDREVAVPRVQYAFGPEGRLEDPELEAEIGGILLELTNEVAERVSS